MFDENKLEPILNHGRACRVSSGVYFVGLVIILSCWVRRLQFREKTSAPSMPKDPPRMVGKPNPVMPFVNSLKRSPAKTFPAVGKAGEQGIPKRTPLNALEREGGWGERKFVYQSFSRQQSSKTSVIASEIDTCKQIRRASVLDAV